MGKLHLIVCAFAAPAALAFAEAPAGLADAPPAASATVRVTGEWLTVNGQSEIPRGLFGVHAVPLTPENIADMGIECTRQIHYHAAPKPIAIGKDDALRAPYDKLLTIDCQNDRYVPATVLTNPKYEEMYTTLGRQYAAASKAFPQYTFYTEFWNEAYLNWAERSHGAKRNNYYPGFYDVSKAVDGGPVTIKGWDKPLEHLRWKQRWAKGEDGNIYFGVKLPEGAKPGDTFRGRSPWYWTNRAEQTFTVVEEWHVHDPSTGQWFSGKQNLEFYLWMFMPYAKAVKETNPAVQVVAGFNFGLHHGDYSVWKDLTRPLIDAAPTLIDGISEHHYGVDTRHVTSWYEIIATYAMSRHGRFIKGFNTECGAILDPAVYGPPASRGAEDSAARRLGDAQYTLRDIIELAALAPDKVGSRTHHHAMPQTGAAAALRFLKELRGPMVAAESEDAELWPVASVSGERGNRRLVVVLFNNAREARAVALDLVRPGDGVFGDGSVSTLAVAGSPGRLEVATSAAPAAGKAATVNYTLPSRHALKVMLPLMEPLPTAVPAEDVPATTRAALPPGPRRERQQYFPREPLVVQAVAAGKPLSLTVNLPADALRRATGARLRVVLDHNVGRAVTCTLNGTPVKLPDRAFATDVSLDVKTLKPENTLTFTAGDRAYQVNAASVYLDMPG